MATSTSFIKSGTFSLLSPRNRRRTAGAEPAAACAKNAHPRRSCRWGSSDLSPALAEPHLEAKVIVECGIEKFDVDVAGHDFSRTSPSPGGLPTISPSADMAQETLDKCQDLRRQLAENERPVDGRSNKGIVQRRHRPRECTDTTFSGEKENNELKIMLQLQFIRNGLYLWLKKQPLNFNMNVNN